MNALGRLVTLVVINKTYGDLNSTLSIDHLPASVTSAQSFLYSNANLAAILARPNLTVTPSSGANTASTISTTFPAQSITLLVAGILRGRPAVASGLCLSPVPIP